MYSTCPGVGSLTIRNNIRKKIEKVTKNRQLACFLSDKIGDFENDEKDFGEDTSKCRLFVCIPLVF